MTHEFNERLKSEYKRWSDFSSKGLAESFLYNEGYTKSSESVWMRADKPAYIYQYFDSVVSFNENGSFKDSKKIILGWRVGFGDHVTENKCLANRFKG